MGYRDTVNALKKHVDDEDKIMGCQNATPSVTDDLGRIQYPTWINESGLYSLILSSKLPTAKKFKRWVTSEILPSIRKHGAYMTSETKETILKRLFRRALQQRNGALHTVLQLHICQSS